MGSTGHYIGEHQESIGVCIGVIKGDTNRLDHGSYGAGIAVSKPLTGFHLSGRGRTPHC